MNITGVTGISDAQKAALKALGAIERANSFALVDNTGDSRVAANPGQKGVNAFA